MKVVDKRCDDCGITVENVFDDEKHICRHCGGEMKRVFGNINKYPEYPEGYYEHFDAEPLYIKDREHFYKEAKKRNLSPVVPEAAKRRKKEMARKTFVVGG